MLVSRFPYPLEKGDKLRAYYQLKELSKRFDITLVALSDKPVSNEQISKVSNYCSSVHVYRLSWFSRLFHLIRCAFGDRPFQTGYFYNYKAHRSIKQLVKTEQIDHIYCQLLRTAEYVKNLHTIPKTIDYMDALSAGIERRISQQPWYKKWLFIIEARRLKVYERHLFDFFEHKTIISEQDRQLIQHPNKHEIKCIPNGIDSSFFEKIDQPKTHDFVFVGNMSYPPNVEAVFYIVNEILPAFPDSKLLVSGSSPVASIKNLAETNAAIELTGWVDDIRTSYARGQIFLAPMMIGTGMQNKLLEAMAMNIPCVTTSLANNAIKAKDGEQIMVGDSKTEIINCIKQLRSDNKLAKEMAANASNFVKEEYSWERSTEQLEDLLKTNN